MKLCSLAFLMVALPLVANAQTAAPTATAPVSKLWPRETVRVFLPRCTGLRVQFVEPCTCIITKLMAAMPHDEFLRKSENGTIEQDQRLIDIRTSCASAPQRKD